MHLLKTKGVVIVLGGVALVLLIITAFLFYSNWQDITASPGQKKETDTSRKLFLLSLQGQVQGYASEVGGIYPDNLEPVITRAKSLISQYTDFDSSWFQTLYVENKDSLEYTVASDKKSFTLCIDLYLEDRLCREDGNSKISKKSTSVTRSSSSTNETSGIKSSQNIRKDASSSPDGAYDGYDINKFEDVIIGSGPEVVVGMTITFRSETRSPSGNVIESAEETWPVQKMDLELFGGMRVGGKRVWAFPVVYGGLLSPEELAEAERTNSLENLKFYYEIEILTAQ